ncbi:type II secretion system F family protein [Nesterenkonia cremea]|uniref:type II secretion system F family protein n=1 Tax=Nesterenkonia cremea TaxID=1882340 RepID=UPI00166A3AA3|nr:type II secretion system F family protein [Nesterenkonia cremea]
MSEPALMVAGAAQVMMGSASPRPLSPLITPMVPSLLPAAAGMFLAAAAVLLLLPAAARSSAAAQRRTARGRTARRRSASVRSARPTAHQSSPVTQHLPEPGLLRRLLRRRGAQQEAAQAVDAAGLLDLTGALLSSGVGIEAALDRLAACVPGAEPLAHVHRSLTAGAPWETAWAGVGDHPELRLFGRQLAFAHATGAPTAELLQTGARQARAEHRQQAEQRAARLGVQMVIPLGICFLPAFVLLGVVPVVLALVPEALGQMD